MWTAGTSLREKRYDVKVVSAHDKLFAAFSKDSDEKSSCYKRTWEYLHSKLTSKWEYFDSKIKLVREGCRVVQTKGILYFVGGDRRQTKRCSVTEFHLTSNTFNTSRPQEFRPVRTGFAAAALGGFIYFVGGRTVSDNKLVTTFQRFDPGHGVTKDLKDPPNAPGNNVRAVIIESTTLPEPQPGPSRILIGLDASEKASNLD